MHPQEDEIRLAELDRLRRWFGGDVLEIGGGSGLQSSVLASWGCGVATVDIPRADRLATHYDVIEYDGVNLPFGPSTFDVVYSSNTLEHVVDLSGLLAEIRRVMKPGGVGVHAMPSPTWRAATMAAWPVAVVRHRWSDRSQPLLRRITDAVVAKPHGEYASAWVELSEFRRRAWVRRFETAGIHVREITSGGYFYEGAGLTRMPLRYRSRLARLVGPAVWVYITD